MTDREPLKRKLFMKYSRIIKQKKAKIIIRNLLYYIWFRQTKQNAYTEFPKMIDFLIGYLNAGLHPLQALERVVQNVLFSRSVRFQIFKLISLCTRGYSFVDATDIVLKDIQCNNSRRHLALFFVGLKMSFFCGNGSVKTLQNIRNKVLEEIQFQKKFRILTAQMRLQANVILLSPLCLGFLLMLISPEHILIFFESPFGIIIFAIMCILNLAAVYFIKKTINIVI